jgi:hypothetical protein
VILSEPSSKRDETPAGPLYRKPRADVFTMLLVLALLAILLAIAALYAIMKEYDFKFKAPSAGLGGAVSTAPRVASAPSASSPVAVQSLV